MEGSVSGTVTFVCAKASDVKRRRMLTSVEMEYIETKRGR